MSKSRFAILVAIFTLIFAMFIPVMAQDELPIAEEDFVNAETLVVFCFGGTDNYYNFLAAETEEDAMAVMVDGVGLDEDTAGAFISDVSDLADELGEDVDEVTAKSYFYALVITHCFGEEAVATVAEAEDPSYYVTYFELDDDQSAYFYYLYEETYFYISVEAYLIDLGVDPADIDNILAMLDDQEALAAYFAEIGLDIDLDAFYADLDTLEADAEGEFTEDEAYVDDEEADSDGDGVVDAEDEDDDGDGVDDAEDDDDDGDGVSDDDEADDAEMDDGEGDDSSDDGEEGDDSGDDDGGDDDGGDD